MNKDLDTRPLRRMLRTIIKTLGNQSYEAYRTRKAILTIWRLQAKQNNQKREDKP